MKSSEVGSGNWGRCSKSVNRSSVFVKSGFKASFGLPNRLFLTLGAVNHVKNIFVLQFK